MIYVVTRDPRQPVKTVHIVKAVDGYAIVESIGAVSVCPAHPGVPLFLIEQAIARQIADDIPIPTGEGAKR